MSNKPAAKNLAERLLNMRSWRVVGTLPEVQKCVIIFAPHTSNWDFVLMYMAKIALRVRANYLGKHSLFYWPTGWFFRALGGIPVVRHEKHNVVDMAISAFNNNDRLWLAMAPEGTRSKTDCWRTGFYHIAVGAKVPVQLCYLDSRKREMGLGPLLQLSGNIEEDFAQFRAFYQDKQGIRPHLASLIQPRRA